MKSLADIEGLPGRRRRSVRTYGLPNSPPYSLSLLPNMPLTVAHSRLLLPSSGVSPNGGDEKGITEIGFRSSESPSDCPQSRAEPEPAAAARRFLIKPDQNNISRTKRFSGATKVK